MTTSESARGAAPAHASGPPDLDDSAEALQAKETEHRIPPGLQVLFAGLVAWALYYAATYLTWDQASELEAGGGAAGNIVQAVSFTAIPAVVIVALAAAMARRGKRR